MIWPLFKKSFFCSADPLLSSGVIRSAIVYFFVPNTQKSANKTYPIFSPPKKERKKERKIVIITAHYDWLTALAPPPPFSHIRDWYLSLFPYA